jgi:hypothetical protein
MALRRESEGRIIAIGGGQPEEVIENTGRIEFWRRPGQKTLLGRRYSTARDCCAAVSAVNRLLTRAVLYQSHVF